MSEKVKLQNLSDFQKETFSEEFIAAANEQYQLYEVIGKLETALEAARTAESQLASINAEQVEIIRQLQTDLEAAKSENAEQKKITEITAKVAYLAVKQLERADVCPDDIYPEDIRQRKEFRCNACASTSMMIIECWLRYFRAEAEKEVNMKEAIKSGIREATIQMFQHIKE